MVREGGLAQEVGSPHWSVGLSSSRELKADGGSLKCSCWRRQRLGGLWCNLIGVGGGEENLGACPQSRVTSTSQLSGRRGFVPCSLGKAALYVVGPIIGGEEIFTYVSVNEGVRQDPRFNRSA